MSDELEYTRELPTVEGWYWWWDGCHPRKDEPRIVEEFTEWLDNGNLGPVLRGRLFCSGKKGGPIEKIGGYWAGPLPLPSAPREATK